jgi:hypothetical protein
MIIVNVVIDFKKLEQLGILVNESLGSIASRILQDNLEAFKELAK